MNLNTLIESYYEARRKDDEASEAKKRTYDVLKHTERTLIDAMLAEGMPSIRRDDGTTVSLRKSLSFSCTQENMDQIREWLVAEFGDDAPFVAEVVVKKSLTEKLAELLEAGSDESEMPQFLNVSTRPTISVRGWKEVS